MRWLDFGESIFKFFQYVNFSNCFSRYTSLTFSYQLHSSRTLLALGLGASGAIVSIVIVGMKIATAYAPEWVERMVSALLFVAMSFGTAYITSESGPGAPLGNLYYSTVSSFSACSLIFIHITIINLSDLFLFFSSFYSYVSGHLLSLCF